MEVEVFARVGSWKSYEELEENLTIEQLADLVVTLHKIDKEEFRRMVIAAHGEDPFPDGDQEDRSETTFDDIVRRTTGKDYGDAAVNELNDILSMDGMVDPFGYSVEP